MPGYSRPQEEAVKEGGIQDTSLPSRILSREHETCVKGKCASYLACFLLRLRLCFIFSLCFCSVTQLKSMFLIIGRLPSVLQLVPWSFQGTHHSSMPIISEESGSTVFPTWEIFTSLPNHVSNSNDLRYLWVSQLLLSQKHAECQAQYRSVLRTSLRTQISSRICPHTMVDELRLTNGPCILRPKKCRKSTLWS